MSPLRQFRPLIRAGDVGAKVGGVVGQSLKLQLLDTDHFPDQSLLDLRQVVCWQDVHLIPEVLAGEIGGGELHELRQIRCAKGAAPRGPDVEGAADDAAADKAPAVLLSFSARFACARWPE